MRGRGAVGLRDARRPGRQPDLPDSAAPLDRDPLAQAQPGHPGRWPLLQRLRRGQLPLEPWLAALATGALTPEPDLLAALWLQLDRPAVERLLAGAVGAEPQALLQAGRAELPAAAGQAAVAQAWLEPLLARAAGAAPDSQPVWLELVGHFREPRVAALLRQVISTGVPATPPPAALEPLLPLLGQQRQAPDAALLLEQALRPGRLAWRRAALEGLALGLSAWPPAPLALGLEQLATDLDPGLAATAVDLLARLPEGQRRLRRLQRRRLDPRVAERLARRLPRSPLVLVVHGRQGGLIPEPLQSVARELEQRRGTPVRLHALTAAPPDVDPRLQLAAARAGQLTLVPLLLLPGGHVRHDLPALAADWRLRLPPGPQAPQILRVPFLGAWPAFQALLARQLDAAAAGRPLLWLHHPLQGRPAERFLAHLARVLGRPGVAVAYRSEPALLRQLASTAPVLAPLTLAPNRLSESLNMGAHGPSAEVLPPLLDLPAVRDFLLTSLEALP